MNTNLTRLAAGGLLVLTLAACGQDSPTSGAAGTSTQEPSQVSRTGSAGPGAATETSHAAETTHSTGTTQTTEPGRSTSDPTKTNTGEPTTSTGPDTPVSSDATPAPAATRTILLNPKAADGSLAQGWKVVAEGMDPCSTQGAADPSPVAVGRNVFTCGPTAAALLACWTFPGDKIGCVRDADRTIYMFTSKRTYSGAQVAEPSPIAVRLSDGTMCSMAMHDHGQHWQGRQGWLHCRDGRMLLTQGNDGDGSYFDKTNPAWTADAVPQQGVVAPKRVTVASVTFARGD